ncbi:HRQ1 [[Candida] subhashii]|uniref:HRQ1 n=1 Tax=[Candida] subhashii TaxID=561895 RepID=A0A8J5UX53_9ASCO|nr:HRQ1 [[Candida] subhashii]KAG7662179.1 HRQ1 [[Candida] subhashii]
MNNHDISIPKSWSLFFQRLTKIYFQINTHLTFLSSHSRTVIPSIDLIQKLNNSITINDLTIIKLLFPNNEIFFDYVDENQIMLSFIEDVKSDYEKGYHQTSIVDRQNYDDDPETLQSKQILIFDFQDAKLHGIGLARKGGGRKRIKKETTRSNPDDYDQGQRRDFFLSNAAYHLTPLNKQQLMNLIQSRNAKFLQLITEYLLKYTSKNGEVDYDKAEVDLIDQSELALPKPADLKDIVQVLNDKEEHQAVDPTHEECSTDYMIESLKSAKFYQDQITSIYTLNEAQEPKYQTLSPEVSSSLHPKLKEAIQLSKNIDIENGLYCHQAMALETLLSPSSPDSHVIVSTPTASGKSLIYQIPVLNSILWDITYGLKGRHSTAFFIFPTKALAQDQMRHIKEFINYIPGNIDNPIIVNTYDGDTPFTERIRISKESHILFTNPDTIHASILPNNHFESWRQFLQSLKFVVMDELHIYKGTFGINVSYVMSRLLRIKHHLCPSEPNARFISCSATIENPITHFKAVCSLSNIENIIHINQDGSPHCEKKLLVWNPPELMNKRGQKNANNGNDQVVPRVGMISESARVLVNLLNSIPGIKAIVFCPIRVVCEMLMKEIRYLLQNEFPNSNIDQSDVMAYRGGYSKSDRRIIEQKMFSGQLRAIIATNALELGIDLSDLDVVITCGFPMSKSNLHQQFGRAGRGNSSKGSLAIYVPGRNPVDQYYLENSYELCQRHYEDLCVQGLRDMDCSSLIMEQHLQCAAYELPIDLDADRRWFSSELSFNAYTKTLKDHLLFDIDGKYKPNPNYLPKPHSSVNIRVIEETQFAVVDITNNRNIVIEEVEASRTSFTLYEGGIFLHQGQPYLVKEFNHKDHYAKVERVNVDWTTSQRDFTDIDPLEVEAVKPLFPLQASKPLDIPIFFGKIKITMIVFGFFKVNRREEIIEVVEVKNPPVVMHSKGFWINIPKRALEIITEKSLSAAGGVHAAEHAIMNMLPVFINGNSSKQTTSSNAFSLELSTECKAPEKEFSGRETSRKRPARLIFYDTKGGKLGTGIGYKAFECMDEILDVTFKRVRDCECDWGCPLCVVGECRENMTVMSKPAAIIILGSLLGVDLEELSEQIPDGPEMNMPEVNTETIIEGSSTVKFSPNVKISKVIRKRRCFT